MSEGKLSAKLSPKGSLRGAMKGGGFVVIDQTLSIQGAAADAKAVGDALDLIDEKLIAITDEQIDELFE